MQIAPGTQIGSYSVVDAIGAGGMGNVFRANDSRLGRDVAIKALPGHLASNPDALARFEREARFLASLNHPNIASIYGVEEHDGERLLILELVPGETLDQILERGPLSVDDTVRYATDVASALEAAHESGIVHRDLKPSNVKITPQGHVKLLDFGIAKHLASGADTANPRVDTQITRAGSVMGTPHYMSPEQITDGDVDRRTDVWAFGCLIYEMLTGRRAFDSPTFLALADEIRNSDPAWNVLPRATPDPLRRLVTRCLRKNPHERLQNMGDARVELEELRAERGGARSIARSRARVYVLAAFVVALGALAIWQATSRVDDEPLSPPRLTQVTSEAGVEQFPAWSRDGQSLVYAGDVAGTAGVRKLFVRRIGAPDAQQITTGDFDDIQPAWLDAQRIVFVRARDANRRLEPGDVYGMYEPQGGDLWTIDVTTKQESRLLERAYYPAVAPDGRSIAFDASWAGPRRIWLSDARGVNPQQLTSDSSEAVVHIQPRWSPDGRKIVYQRIERTRFDISVIDVVSRASTRVTNDNYREVNPAWGAEGRAIYFSSDRGGGINLWRFRVDRNGNPIGPPRQLTLGAGHDVQIAMAPDGTRLVYATLRQNADLWRLAIANDATARGAPEALVGTTTEDSRGAWSPDGQRLAFNSDRGGAGDMNIWVYSLADKSTRQITRGAGGDFQARWSPDGTSLAFFSSRAGNADIWRVDVATGALTQITQGHALEVNPFWSPDGTEIVYQSDSSGRLELWASRTDGSNQRQLTSIGVAGHFTPWHADGNVYFRNPVNSALMRVPGKGGEPVQLSASAGSHLSFSSDASKWIDVIGHKVLWLYSLNAPPRQLFTFADAETRIDYPMWSPDGKWLVFDRFRPEGGDIWLAEGIR